MRIKRECLAWPPAHCIRIQSSFLLIGMTSRLCYFCCLPVLSLLSAHQLIKATDSSGPKGFIRTDMLRNPPISREWAAKVMNCAAPQLLTAVDIRLLYAQDPPQCELMFCRDLMNKYMWGQWAACTAKEKINPLAQLQGKQLLLFTTRGRTELRQLLFPKCSPPFTTSPVLHMCLFQETGFYIAALVNTLAHIPCRQS